MSASKSSSGSTLREWIDTQMPCQESLAWCHTTDSWSLQKMIQTGEVQPQPCPVFLEGLSYFFYGRPAYRQALRNARPTAKAPVVVLFHSAVANRSVRMFPFDSGAFHAGRYADWFHEDMTCDEFALTPSLDSARKHVSAFFGSNRRYWNCDPLPLPKAPGVELLVEALQQFLSDPSSQKADDRRHCVEAQIACPIPFDPTAVRAVVLPATQMDTECIKTFASTSGRSIHWIGYPLNQYKSATEYQVYLEERARQAQEQSGEL
jgi:hypothetical protein